MELDNKNRQIEQLTSKNQSLLNENNELTQEATELSEQLHEALLANDLLAIQISSSYDQISESNRTLQERSAEHDQLKTQHKTTLSERDAVREENEGLKVEIEKLRTENKKLTHELETKTPTELEKELKEWKSIATKYQQEACQLKNKISLMQREMNSTKQNLSQQTAALAASEEKIKQLGTWVISLKMALLDARKKQLTITTTPPTHLPASFPDHVQYHPTV